MIRPKHFRLDPDSYKEIFDNEGVDAFCSAIQTDLEIEREKVRKQIDNLKTFYKEVKQSPRQVNYAETMANKYLLEWTLQEYWLNNLIGFFCSSDEILTTDYSGNEAYNEFFKDEQQVSLAKDDNTVIFEIFEDSILKSICAIVSFIVDVEFVTPSQRTYIAIPDKMPAKRLGELKEVFVYEEEVELFGDSFVSHDPLRLVQMLKEYNYIKEVDVLVIHHPNLKMQGPGPIERITIDTTDYGYWNDTWEWVMNQSAELYGADYPYYGIEQISLSGTKNKNSKKPKNESLPTPKYIDLAGANVEIPNLSDFHKSFKKFEYEMGADAWKSHYTKLTLLRKTLGKKQLGYEFKDNDLIPKGEWWQTKNEAIEFAYEKIYKPQSIEVALTIRTQIEVEEMIKKLKMAI